MDSEPYATLASDPVMQGLIDEHGRIELEPADDDFERLVVSVINQQVSTASANAVRERLFDEFEVSPESLLEADARRLRDVGLSNQKVEYIRSISEAFHDGDVSREEFRETDNDEVVERLTDIHGVGEWTAEMYLIFGLGREDVLPLGDLAVRRSFEELYDADDRDSMRREAEAWRPYRSVGTLYLWEWYES